MSVIYPLLAQVLLTLIIGLRLMLARVGALKKREVTFRQIALSNSAWPERVMKLTNSFSNQFETPVLFYALIAAALYVGATGLTMTVLAWVFVLSRLAHHLIHSGGNNIMNRFRAFIAGVIVLFLMLCAVVVAMVH